MKKSLSAISIILFLCSCTETVEVHNESTITTQTADTTRPVTDTTHQVVPQAVDTPVRHTDTITRVRPHGTAIKHGSPNQQQLDSVVKVKTDGKFKKK